MEWFLAKIGWNYLVEHKLELVLGLVIMLVAMYWFRRLKYSRYDGKNPRHCPNCGKNTCVYYLNGGPYENRYEQWKCPSCGAHYEYYINKKKS